MTKHPEISVVIPAYNEEKTIVKNVLEVDTYLASRFERYEIIVSSDGSHDHTVEQLERLKGDHPSLPLLVVALKRNHGKGMAVKKGILASHYDPVMFLDADLTIPIEEVECFVPQMKYHPIAVASRLHSETSFEEPVPWYRQLMARGFQILQMIVIGNSRITDTQCGFKMFRRDVAMHIFPLVTISRFAFDAEMFFLAHKFGYGIKQMPIRVKKDSRESRVSVLRDPINMFHGLIKIRINNWNGKYDR